MKLKNKKTGEIKELPDGFFCGDNLKKICDEWEDVPEEPKDFWFVGADGEVRETNYLSNNDKSSLRNFGNYFESKEEAELVVRKLMAWKRLKDKGFEFINFPYKKICKYDARTGVGNLEYQVKYYEELESDLDACFGGEE